MYSKDIWDYLTDMPYMPSRKDRDQLVEKGDQKHIQIWDYFFRIREEDVGKPQKEEIGKIKELLVSETKIKNERIAEARSKIASLESKIKVLRGKKARNGVIGLILGVLLSLFGFFVSDSGDEFGIVLLLFCGAPSLLLGFTNLATISFAGKSQKKEIDFLNKEIESIEKRHDKSIEEATKKISEFEKEIELLVQQIPTRPSNGKVQQWLDEDMEALETESVDSTGLGTRLVDIRLTLDGQVVVAPNPIPIMGPGELQNPKNIPQTFDSSYSPDRSKHLRARRAAYVNNDLKVFYGVYYIEHILVADDMLATCGRYFDFITGLSSSEQVTEQYYKDVVAISTTKEFRTITLGDESDKTLSIENAPTFSLSLASGEQRTVTFVNQDYFTGISKKLEIEEDKIKHLTWVADAAQLADNAIKALRAYLRKHKGVNNA